MLHYVSLYGIPSACTSDQGTNFVSNLFKDMQTGLGIDIKHTPIYWPQSNGLVERSHQTLKNAIKAQLIEMGETHQDKWMDYLPWALLGIRTAFNKDLGTFSSELTLLLYHFKKYTKRRILDGGRREKQYYAVLRFSFLHYNSNSL